MAEMKQLSADRGKVKPDRNTERGWSVLPLCVAAVAVWLNACAMQGVPGAPRGFFTEAQTDAGEAVYLTACASCHLTNFQGSGEAPALAGPDFLNSWGPQPVTELLELIAASMPPTAPGSLSDEEYAAVVAYLLSENGVEASETRLTLSSAGQILAGLAGMKVGEVPEGEPRPPVPGIPGNVPSPNAFDRPPPVRGELTETPTARVVTYSPVADFRAGLCCRAHFPARRGLAPLAPDAGWPGLQSPYPDQHL